jgi:UDP-glucose 4-epimerase
VNIVVTGGSGFIGRSVVRYFVERGDHVTVVDRAPYRGGAPVDVIAGDLRESAVVERSIAADTDAIIHLAALTYVLKSMDDPQGVFDVNVVATQALLERARQVGVRHFVFASTNAVAGDHGQQAIDEASALHPLTPYGATKAACEMIISGYAHSYGILGASLRLTNAYGVGMEDKDSVIPRFVRAIKAGRPVTVYGDGTQVRDYVYVTDICRAVDLAIRREFSGTLSIAGGQSYSVLDLVAKLGKVSGRPVQVIHVPPKPGEMPAVRVSPAKARTAIGWEPEIQLDQGLERVWDDLCRQLS